MKASINQIRVVNGRGGGVYSSLNRRNMIVPTVLFDICQFDAENSREENFF